MNLEDLKRIIVSQREEMEEKFTKLKIIGREPEIEDLRNFLEFPNILAILGVRRCGKSIFSWQILRGKKFGYINFDDERLGEFEAKQLNMILQAFYELYGVDLEFMILDEPQNIKKWELFANRLRRTKKVVITGSNSRLLSGELATALTGRHITFELFPFSFREYLNYNDINITKESFYSIKIVSRVKKLLQEFLKIGGLPETYLFGREMALRTYTDIVEKDVIRRLKTRKKAALKELAKYLVTASASEITFRKLSHVLEVKDIHTIKNWIDGLSEAYLITIIERFSPKLKEQLIAPKKVYTLDNGIISTVGFRISEDIGKLMENLVAIELLRRRSYWHHDWEIYYWKDYQQHEVDFVIKEGFNIKQLIQVTHVSGIDEISRRELRSLIKASDLLKCNDLLVITWDYEEEGEFEDKKIKFIPLWKWCSTAFNNI